MEFHVTPSGSSDGTGSLSQPWDLQTALSHPSTVSAGDTIWVHGGIYNGHFSSNLVGTSGARIVVRNYQGQRATINNATDRENLILFSSYTTYWGLEITSSGGRRRLEAFESSPGQGYLDRGIGIKNFGTSNHIINCIIHDCQQGIGSWGFHNSFPGLVIYGCLIYFNGAQQTAAGRSGWGVGHGTYVLSYSNGPTTIRNNIVHSNANTGIRFDWDIYDPDIRENISYHNGDMYSNGGRNVFVNTGQLSGPAVASSVVFRDNCTYYTGQRQVGTFGNIGVSENVHLGLWVESGSLVQSGTVIDNYIAGPFAGAIAAGDSGTPLGLGYFDHFIVTTGTGNVIAGHNYRAYVQAQVPVGSNTYHTGKPSTNAAFLRPNAYEAGRAHIAIYNWQLLSSVTVNLSTAGLTEGQTFVIRDAMNFYGAAVASGTYTAAAPTVSIPMSGLSRAAMVAESDISPQYRPASHTAPEFGAFIVIPTSNLADLEGIGEVGGVSGVGGVGGSGTEIVVLPTHPPVAFDSFQQRAALMQLNLPWVMLLPASDGNVDQGDRQHLSMQLAAPLVGAVAEWPDPQVEGSTTAIVELCLGGSYVNWLRARGTTLHHWFLSDILTTVAKDEISGYGDVVYYEGGEGTYHGLPISARGLLPEYGMATRFDGIDDGVTLPNLSSLASSCTIAILVKPSGAGNDTTRALMHTGPGALYLGLTTLNRFTFGVNGGTQVEVAHTITADESFLLIGVLNVGQARAYVCPMDGSAIVSAGPTAITPASHGVGEIGVNAGANRFKGDLQGAAVMSEPLSLSAIEDLHATTVWTDVTPDVEISSPCTTNRGIHDDSPIARMASTGTCTFVLDNSIRNQAELQSYYSPDHSSGVAGFDYNIPARVSLPYGDAGKIQFIGAVHTLSPIAGIYRERRTLVTCTDWLDEAARTTITGLSVQSNIRPEELIALLINTMRHRPHQVNFQTGTDTYIRALHTSEDESFTVQSELKRINDSEFGWMYMRGDGTFVFETRRSRTGTLTVDHDMENVIEAQQERSRDQVRNRIKVTIHPSRVDAVEVVLYTLESTTGSPPDSTPLEVGIGASLSIFLPFRSELSTTLHGKPTRIGAIDIVYPLPGIDYVINSAKDGSGADLTTHAQLTLSFRLAGNGAYLDIVNETGMLLFFTLLQIRGFGVYDYAPVVALKQDDDSIRKHGIHELSHDMPYQPSIAVAEQVIDGILQQTITPATRVRTITFLNAESDAMDYATVYGEIGQLVRFAELMSGVDEFYHINAIQHDIGVQVTGYEGATMNLAQTTWWLAPKFVLDDDMTCPDGCGIVVMEEDYSEGVSIFGSVDAYDSDIHGIDPHYPNMTESTAGADLILDGIATGQNGVQPTTHATAFQDFRMDNPTGTEEVKIMSGCMFARWKVTNSLPVGAGTGLRPAGNVRGTATASVLVFEANGPVTFGPVVVFDGFDASSPLFPIDWDALIGTVADFKMSWVTVGEFNARQTTYRFYINEVLHSTWEGPATVADAQFNIEGVNFLPDAWPGILGEWRLCKLA